MRTGQLSANGQLPCAPVEIPVGSFGPWRRRNNRAGNPLRDEVIILHLARIAAANMARTGTVAAGYDCLLAGLARAEAARASGEAWGEWLTARWRHAIDDYSRQYDSQEQEEDP